MVGLTKFKLNHQLAEHLRENTKNGNHPLSLEHTGRPYRAAQWRVRDRLSEQQIRDIVTAFKSGTASPVLAERYGINLRSLKKLPREEVVKRNSWEDRQL